MNTEPNSIRLNGKCRRCAAKYSVTATVSWAPRNTVVLTADSGRPLRTIVQNTDEGAAFPCDTEGCKAWVTVRKVEGKFVAGKKCDRRCENATGHDCECACGGHNHGRANAA